MAGWVSRILAVLVVVWMINLYNFMDGMDGFAGGMAVIGFGALAMQGWLTGANEYALINSVIVAAAGGFLMFNFPPARIFMGDTGSATLGLLAAAMALWGRGMKCYRCGRRFWCSRRSLLMPRRH